MTRLSIRFAVEAEQWQGTGKSLPQGCHLCLPEVHWSASRELVYFTYAEYMPKHWISAKPSEVEIAGGGLEGGMSFKKDGKTFYRKVLPFSFWDVKSEASVKGDHRAIFLERSDAELCAAFLDFCYTEKWGEWKDGSFDLPPFAEYREIDGAYGRGYRPIYLKPGDWLLKYEVPDGHANLGRKTVIEAMSNTKFQQYKA